VANPVIFNWPIPTTQAVSQTQTLGSAGNLMINGSLAGGGQVVFVGFARTVSLTSISDLSGVTFVISGLINGLSISDTIAGPNNDTIESDLIFDAILSISTDNAADGISAGIGTTGRTSWFHHLHNTISSDFSIQVNLTSTINYSFITTLTDVKFNLPINIPLFSPISAMIGATTNQLSSYMVPSRSSAIQINSSDTNGTLQAIFIQQGLI
jgi:hypothetical protein